jgi:hypothetical protein
VDNRTEGCVGLRQRRIAAFAAGRQGFRPSLQAACSVAIQSLSRRGRRSRKFGVTPPDCRSTVACTVLKKSALTALAQEGASIKENAVVQRPPQPWGVAAIH